MHIFVGRLRVNKQNVSYEEVQNAFAHLGTGAGHFRPPQCAAEQKSAIIIPFRNRHHHLPILLNNLVPYLLRQRRDFTFYVVEQVITTLPGGAISHLCYK